MEPAILKLFGLRLQHLPALIVMVIKEAVSRDFLQTKTVLKIASCSHSYSNFKLERFNSAL